MEPRAFKAAVIDELRRFLESQGLRKRNGLIFTGQLSQDSLKWVGLSTVTRFPGGSISVNPVIGVRNQAVEKLVAALRGIEFHSYAPATLALPMGGLIPGRDCPPLLFALDREIAPPLENFRRNFQEYACGFYREHASLAAVCGGLKRGEVGIGEARYRLPACYYLLGRKEEAAAFVAERLAALRKAGRESLALEYEEYALRLTRLCHTRSARQA